MHKAPQARHSLAPSVPEVRLRTEGIRAGLAENEHTTALPQAGA